MITAAQRALGGFRERSGRKSEGFRKKCALLANSPKFFIWAQRVFNGEAVDCRLTKSGEKVYLEASTGDRVYLWEKLAAYGFGKPDTIALEAIGQEVQKLIDKNQQRELIESINYPERFTESGIRKAVVASGNTAV